MKKDLVVKLPLELLETIFAGAKLVYPRESFLFLRGKKKKEIIHINDLIVAPMAVHGVGFAHFNPFMITGDYSIMGTVHSHPFGDISPSNVDLNHFFGRIMMIVGPPFEGSENVRVFNSDGDEISLEIT